MAKPDRKKAKAKVSLPKKSSANSVKAKAPKPAKKALTKTVPTKKVVAKAAPKKAIKAIVKATIKAVSAKKAPAKAPIVMEPIRVIKGSYHGEFLQKQKQRLIELRDHLLNQMQGVAQDTLRVRAEGSEASAFGMHQADAGSDAYDKDFALSLLSQEQDALYEIEEAIKRVEGGTYGTCEMSNKPIPKVRLEAIPHARFTVECQAQLERENKGRRRWDTVPQFMDSAEALVEEDDDASEEDDRRKEKE